MKILIFLFRFRTLANSCDKMLLIIGCVYSFINSILQVQDDKFWKIFEKFGRKIDLSYDTKGGGDGGCGEASPP